MRTEPVVFLDFQTTGMAPPAEIIEVGWAVGTPEDARPRASLVRPATGLPDRIARITGIAPEEMETAPSARDVWRTLRKDLAGFEKTIPLVIHYARFELAFLPQLVPRAVRKRFSPICTHEIAARLYPGVPSLGIRGLAGYLGHPVTRFKRAEHHLEATIFIWKSIVAELESRGIGGLDRLSAWLEATPRGTSRRKTFSVRALPRLSLPDRPGVYVFRAGGQILYVGKATSLRDRVNSYFRGRRSKGARLNELIAQIGDIEHHVVGSPLEAAIREHDLIKRHDPPYNRALRKTAKRIVYCDTALTYAARPLRWGPFAVTDTFDRIDELFRLRESPLDTEIFRVPIDSATVAAGFATFEKWYGRPFARDPRSLRSLMAEFFRRHVVRLAEARKARALAAEAADAEEEEVEVEAFAWTPDEFAKHLRRSLGQVAILAFRGRWYRRLAESDLYWKAKRSKEWRHVTIRGGECRFDAECPPKGAKKRITRAKRPPDRVTVMDVETYDRLAVLRAEILKVVQSGARVRLRTAETVLDEGGLRRLMFPGYFP